MRFSRWVAGGGLCAALASLLAAGCSAPAGSAVKATAAAKTTTTVDGTAEMAALLKERAAAVDPARLLFPVNDRRAQMFADQLRGPLPPGRRRTIEFAYARELLQAGQNQEALKAVVALEQDAKANAPALWAAHGAAILILKATTYLRIAEEENCHQGNTRDSCLMPIRGEGVHKKREGATRGAEVLMGILERDPRNLEARWLLNVAHMTLGTYPDGVPKRFLIRPAAFESDYPLPRFDNVAPRVGLDVYGLSGGAVLDDLDGDGRLDLMLSAIGFDDPVRFFHNRGDGTFEERTEQAGLPGITGGLNMIQGDYDNDGRVDVIVLRGAWMKTEGRFPLSLLRNEGGGRFTDVTKAAGLLRFDPTQTAVWFDYDGDGWLDLFVGNESTAAPSRSARSSKRPPPRLVHRLFGIPSLVT